MSKEHAQQRHPIDRVTSWVGSVPSLVLHTLIFGVFFVLAILNIVAWNSMLLVLTTILSLEAIYLAIFIQMSVNRQAESLREVEEDIDEITEDVGELQEDVEDIQEGIGEITEDIEEIHEDDENDAKVDQEHTRTLTQLTDDVRRVLTDLEALKKK